MIDISHYVYIYIIMHNPIIAHYIAISSHIPLIDIYTVYIYPILSNYPSQLVCPTVPFYFIPAIVYTYHIH